MKQYLISEEQLKVLSKAIGYAEDKHFEDNKIDDDTFKAIYASLSILAEDNLVEHKCMCHKG